jgi:hypothetical protein
MCRKKKNIIEERDGVRDTLKGLNKTIHGLGVVERDKQAA